MRNEVSSAVDFITNLLRCKGDNWRKNFKDTLSDILCEHYENHWFPEKPFKGSGYRCIRIVNHKMDPLIAKAGSSCGTTESELLKMLPNELTMWIDPEDVSYRIGEDGSIGVLYEGATKPAVSENQNVQQQQPQVTEEISYHQQQHSQWHSQDFFQTCKHQLKNIHNIHIPGVASDSINGVPFEYLATFVSS